jgi:FtsP/CotA-like multicopper oxidase with cupredoxin domain
MAPITRREALRLGGAALGALVIPDWAAADAVVAVDLVAATGTAAVGGNSAILSTYNGSFPGPLLRWREGDRIRLRLRNRLDEPTNLHLHGLHLPPSIDDPFLEVPPGETTTYEFTVPRDCAGTYWYHPHVHGRVARQLFAGLAGAIVVDPSADDAAISGIEEHVLLLKDLTLRNGRVAAHLPFDWFDGKEGELLLVNGAWRPRLAAAAPLIRLRLINACNARYYRLLLEGHFLYQIATDGGLLDRPIRRQSLLLSPGERAEVLVRLRPDGEFRLLDMPYDRGAAAMHHGHGRGNAEPIPLLSIRTSHHRRFVELPAALGRVRALVPAADAAVRRLVLSEGMMGAFRINGRSFDPRRDDVRGRLGSVEVWEIENRGAMDHPFHLHTYPFQILSIDGTPAAFPAWKDVVNVRPGSRVRLAVPLADFGGRTVFHCHIAEHEDLGMMGVLAV